MSSVVVDEESGEKVVITEEMRSSAIRVHEDVVVHAQHAGYHLLHLGLALKRMRDERLYLALGLRSFSAYCEHCKLPRTVAYDRINVAELNDRLKAMGVDSDYSYTNLLVLVRANPEDRDAVLHAKDIGSSSKREIQRALDDAKKARLQTASAEQRLRVVISEREDAKAQATTHFRDLQRLRSDLERAQQRQAQAERERTELERRLAQAQTNIGKLTGDVQDPIQSVIDANLALRRLDMALATAIQSFETLQDHQIENGIDRSLVRSISDRYEMLHTYLTPALRTAARR